MSNFIKRVKNYDTVVSLYEKTSNVKREEGYGELLMTGVEQLSDFITSIATTNKNRISQSDFFLDVGSGYGKLLIHLSLINDFGKLFGVEKDLDKYEFSKNLKSEFQANNVIFINDDIKNIDVSKVNWIFMNDVLFSKEDSQYVFDNAKPGTHIISFLEGFRNAQDNSDFDCNWYPLPVKFNYYQI